MQRRPRPGLGHARRRQGSALLARQELFRDSRRPSRPVGRLAGPSRPTDPLCRIQSSSPSHIVLVLNLWLYAVLQIASYFNAHPQNCLRLQSSQIHQFWGVWIAQCRSQKVSEVDSHWKEILINDFVCVNRLQLALSLSRAFIKPVVFSNWKGRLRQTVTSDCLFLTLKAITMLYKVFKIDHCKSSF